MQTNAHPLAHFITKVVGVNNDTEPIEVEIIIRRGISAQPAIHKEDLLAPGATRKDSPYVHSITTNLSDANKRGLDNLAYWSNGPRSSKSYLINQALAQYLAQYKESQKSFPLDEA